MRDIESFFTLNKRLGIFPFNFVKGGIKISKKYVIFTIFIIFFSISIGLFFSIYSSFSSHYLIKHLLLNVAMYFPFVSTIIANFLSCFLNRKKFVKIFTLIREIYKRCGPIEGKYGTLCTNFFLFFSTSSSIIAVIFKIPDFYSKIKESSFLIISTYFYLIFYQFIWLLSVVNEGLNRLNHLLKMSNVDILECTIFHERIITLCDLLNFCFGPHLLILFTSTFFYVTILSSRFSPDMTSNIILIAWSLYFLVISFTVVYYCEQSAKLSQKFARKVDKIVLRKLKDSQKILVSHILWKRKIKFSALSFFDVNFKIFTSMAGACMTYAIILVQDKSYSALEL